MQETLKLILAIQEFDIKMIRLMSIKKQREKELKQIADVRQELIEQLEQKRLEIVKLNEEALFYEKSMEENKEKIKKLESKQTSIKKIEEFNALTKEITSLEREKTSFEQTLSNLVDKKGVEEELYEKTKKALQESDERNETLEGEIRETIQKVNEEGRALKQKREELAKRAEPSIFSIYEKLLYNKKDRVVVAIENRNCTGCHIALTAQHENIVRKGEKLVFCEHCSRIHFWGDSGIDGGVEMKKRRRRSAGTLKK